MIAFLADNIAAGYLCVCRRRSISSVFTNKFLLTTASLYSRLFFGSEIISNGRFNALNTWRHCVNNRNTSVEEKRSLWSPQCCLQLVSTLQYVNLPNCWNLVLSSCFFLFFTVFLSCISYFHRESNYFPLHTSSVRPHNALNTWSHCVNNRNTSVEEKRSLWSP